MYLFGWGGVFFTPLDVCEELMLTSNCACSLTIKYNIIEMLRMIKNQNNNRVPMLSTFGACDDTG